jgi:hypothetical protein
MSREKTALEKLSSGTSDVESVETSLRKLSEAFKITGNETVYKALIAQANKLGQATAELVASKGLIVRSLAATQQRGDDDGPNYERDVEDRSSEVASEAVA